MLALLILPIVKSTVLHNWVLKSTSAFDGSIYITPAVMQPDSFVFLTNKSVEWKLINQITNFIFHRHKIK